jgi:hypothetical protein
VLFLNKALFISVLLFVYAFGAELEESSAKRARIEGASSSSVAERTPSLTSSVTPLQPQQEEQWRWRNSLNFSYKDFKSLAAGFDVDEFHNQMATQELAISEIFSPKERGNFLIGAISVLVRKKETGEWHVIRDYIRASNDGNKPIIFVSGFLNRSQKDNIEKSGYRARYSFQDENSHGSRDSIKRDLSYLLKWMQNKTKVIENSFKHSEEYLHLFLSRKVEVIERILAVAQVSPEDEVHTIILHLHSRLDMCAECSASLSWLCGHPQSCIEDMKKSIRVRYNVPDKTQENGEIKFLLLFSSREVFTDACGRRWKSGHDGGYSTVINAETYPPILLLK